MVFLSSTSDLAEQREALRQALERERVFRPYLHEHDTAGRDTPMSRIERLIDRADIFVAVLGGRYGSPLPNDPEKRSISHWELDIARARNDLSIRAFLLAVPPEAIDQPQQAFRDEISDFKTGLWLKPVASTAELSNSVVAELREWLREYLVRLRAAKPFVQQWLDRRLVTISFLAALLGLGVPVANVIWHFTTTPASIAVGAVCFLVILACLFLRNREEGDFNDDTR